MTDSEYRQLTEFLGQQFVLIDQRFVAIDQRFAAMDQRFDALDRRVEVGFRDVLGHLDAIYGRLERLEQEYAAVLEGLRRIEAWLGDERVRGDALEQGLASLKERVALLQARIEDVERRLRE